MAQPSSHGGSRARRWATLNDRHLADRMDASVAQADIDIVADDEMESSTGIQQPASRHRLRGQVQVIRARRRIPDGWLWTRMMPAAAAGRHPERAHRRGPTRRRRSSVDRLDRQHDVLRVEQDHPQLLPLETAHLQDEAISEVARPPDREPAGGPIGQQPAAKLEGGRETSGSRGPDTRDGLKLDDARL
jgi:hypothetical protein